MATASKFDTSMCLEHMGMTMKPAAAAVAPAVPCHPSSANDGD